MELENKDKSKLKNVSDEKKGPSFSIMEIYATFVAAFSFLCIGLLRAYTSPAIASMKNDPDIFNTTTISEKEVISWTASSPPLASFIGTVISGPFLQFCGRQKTIFLLTLPLIAGWALIGFAQNVLMLLSGRILTGLAAGISTAGAQLYVSECVRPEVRGTLGFLPSMMLALGMLLGFAASTINVEWRELALIMCSFPIALLVMSLTVPESPPWLIMRGNIAQATVNLGKFRGPTVEKGEIADEIEAVRDAVNQENRNRRTSRMSIVSVTSAAVVSFWKKVSNFITLLKKRQIWLPAFIAVALMMFQQLIGANFVIYFLSIILTDAEPRILKTMKIMGTQTNLTLQQLADGNDFDEKSYHVLNHNVGSVIVATVQFLAFFLSLPLIDRLGRKILLIISANLMALSLGVFGLYFYCNAYAAPMSSTVGVQGESTDSLGNIVLMTYSWLPLTCLSVFIASYSVGFGPVPFIIMSEIFPAQARSYLCSLTSFANHFFLFVVIKLYPTMTEHIGNHGTFFVCAAISMLSMLLVIFVLPETKGKTLTEIEGAFTKDSKPLLLDRRDSYAVGLP